MREPPSEIIILSLPTAFGRWLLHRTIKCLELQKVKVEQIYIDRHDEVPVRAEIQNKHEVTLFWANYPSRSLLDYATAKKLPIIIGLMSEVQAVEDMCAVQGCSFLEALRPNSASAALISEFAALETAQIFTLGTGDEAAADIDAALNQILKIDRKTKATKASVNDAILADLGENRVAYASKANLSERDCLVARSSIGAVIRAIGQPNRSTITWYHDVFLSGDLLGSVANRVSDITGPARVIYYGPYLHLPLGNWAVRLLVGFSNDIDDMSFSVDVVTFETLVSARMKPEKGGAFKTQFQLNFMQPDQPVEMRIRSEAGAIEGKIVLQSVEFIPFKA